MSIRVGLHCLTQITQQLAFAVARKRVCITSTRLFLRDSFLAEFTTRAQRQWEDDGRNLLTLSETAFYPTSGGQPHDTGTIDGVDVLDVFEDDGEIIHVLDGVIESSTELTGRVNWPRRHDHMQQHTGQHILSQALNQICDISTLGFTIGPDWSTIVLEKKPDREALETALTLANSVIDDDRPVEMLFPSARELEELPIRGVPPDKEHIRVVRIEGFDWSPCGGTHSKSTGDVRLIVALGIRKEKDSHRLEFVCGRRAEETALEHARTVSDVGVLLDVGPAEIVERSRALLEKLRVREKTIDELREARLKLDNERLHASIRENDEKTIAVVLDGRSVQELRQLAHLLVEQPNTVALLVGIEDMKVGLAFARSEERTENMNQVMKTVCGETGCRGGGNPAFATGGGGGDVDPEKVLEVAKRALAIESHCRE